MGSSGGGWKYDVFLNFRGADTRRSFVGHLYKALHQKAINTFIDAENKDFSALLKAIQQSRASIVVFSQNYASSTWCLNELVKILESMDTKEQIVVPIFYQVDPSDIRKPKRSFAEAFAGHSHTNMKEMLSWRTALTRATNLPGWDSRDYRDDAEFIEKIVEDIFKKLICVSSSKAEILVGMDSHLSEIDLLLCPWVADVRIIGIWGTGGIGKTTLAKAVYDRISLQFDYSCILENVKQGFLKNGAVHMQEELVSRMLKENVRNLGTLNRGSKIIMERFCKKKVFLVLDDVENCSQVETLLGNQHSFGGGSRVIITTRDIHSLSGVDATYRPRLLNDDEALELFMHYAFRTSQTKGEYNCLSRQAINCARGLPLSLKVLGAFLDNKSEREWENVLENIKKIPHIGIEDVLKTSFDGLDNSEKEIFLDIACFFRGMDKVTVTDFLDSCGFYPVSGLRALVDRALITVSNDNKLEMHDLLQEMGWNAVRQESIEEPGRRSRLWCYEDVYHVLTQNTATEAVQGIFLNLSNSSKEACINTEAFIKMKKLRLLKIVHDKCSYRNLCLLSDNCKQHMSGDLKFLSHELRCLTWDGYPQKSLPSNFAPKYLVFLYMRYSRIEQLWEGIKPLGKLKFIDLSHSRCLYRTPDLSEAPHLETLILECCSSLFEVHPSISALKNLAFLSFKNCKELKNLASSIGMNSLETLNLSGCSKLEKFPEISEVMNDLLELHLDETAIKELPSSIDSLQGLHLLNVRNCRSLVHLPDSICNLANLTDLNLSGCSKLYHLPENLWSLKSLKALEVEGSGIKELPFSILRLNKLDGLPSDRWNEMTVPLSSLPSSVNTNWFYSGLIHLDLSDCNLWELSDGIAYLSSLKILELRRNNMESLPATMSRLRCLTYLELESCKRLKSIPELSSSINFIDAHDCTALQTVSTPKPLESCETLKPIPELSSSINFIDAQDCTVLETVSIPDPGYSGNLCFTFSNCFQLVQTNLFRDIVDANSHYQGYYYLRPLSFNMSLPGSKIPDWFSYQCMGSSVTAQLPPNWFDNKFLGFAICAVSNFKGGHSYASDLSTKCFCTFKGNHREYSFSFYLHGWSFRSERFLESDHMFLGYVPWSKYRLIEKGERVNERYYTVATFSILVENGVYSRDFGEPLQHPSISSCGVHFFCEEVQNLSMLKTKGHSENSGVTYQGFGKQIEEVSSAKSSREGCCYNYGGDTSDEEQYPKNSKECFPEPSGWNPFDNDDSLH